ncbi:hypothetical protein KJ865_13300, partial [Myxococcota bacterium]|nr:hypothetical protein [Myxococcota bacterium]
AMPADAMPADAMPADVMKPYPPKVETKKVMVFTTIDSFNPPPIIKANGKECKSPCTIDVPKDSTTVVQISRNGYYTSTQVVKGEGPARLKITMKRKRSGSHTPTMIHRPMPMHITMTIMRPMTMKPIWD